MTIDADLKMDLVNRYVAGTVRLLALVEDLPEYQLDWQSDADGWSIRAVIHHVVDGLDVWSVIIKNGLAIDGIQVHFNDFPGNEAWADALCYSRREIATGLEVLRAHAGYMASLLSCFPDSWHNSVNYITPTGEAAGANSIEQVVAMLAEHFEEHAAQIELILAANRG